MPSDLLNALTIIRDVWNDTHYVRTDDIHDPSKKLLALYNRDGKPKVLGKLGHMSIRRDNVKRVG